MKKKLLPLLGIAFVVAVVATGIFYGLIVNRLRNASSSRPQLTILVAARNLERGTVLMPSAVKLAPWAGPEAPKGSLTSPEQIEGHTVLETIQENEPVTLSRLASQKSGGAALAIPAGMRAVSVRVSDTQGVVGLLRAGHRVDVQAARGRSGRDGGEMELRTVLQNVEVLSGPQPESGSMRGALSPVVTLLVRPAEAETLGMADSGARIRLLLRNPLDQEQLDLRGMAVATLFHPRSPGTPLPTPAAIVSSKSLARLPTAVIAAGARPPREDQRVLLRVQIAGAGQAALEELGTRMLVSPRSDLLQVSALRRGWDLEKAVRGMQAKRLLQVLAASHLLSGHNREVSVEAGAHGSAERSEACGLRVQFRPAISAAGTLRVRVQPEIIAPQGANRTTRKIETEVEVAEGQGFLVLGLGESGDGASLVEKLFPGQVKDARNREVVILVTPQFVAPPAGNRQTASLVKER